MIIEEEENIRRLEREDRAVDAVDAVDQWRRGIGEG